MNSIVKNIFCTIIFFHFSLCFAGEYTDPSFDCDVADKRVERLICSFEDLCVLDAELYKKLKKLSKTDSELGNDGGAQISWISNVRNRCHDVSCIRNVYIVRTRDVDAIALKLLAKRTSDSEKNITHAVSNESWKSVEIQSQAPLPSPKINKSEKSVEIQSQVSLPSPKVSDSVKKNSDNNNSKEVNKGFDIGGILTTMLGFIIYIWWLSKDYHSAEPEPEPEKCPDCNFNKIETVKTEELDRWRGHTTVSETLGSGKRRTRVISATFVKLKKLLKCEKCGYQWETVDDYEK